MKQLWAQKDRRQSTTDRVDDGGPDVLRRPLEVAGHDLLAEDPSRFFYISSSNMCPLSRNQLRAFSIVGVCVRTILQNRDV